MKYFLIVLLLGLILFFSFLGGTSVFQVAEARNAECAREMLAHDNWIVPTFNGDLRTDKPALEYYGMMVAYLVFGINEISARLFSAICGLLVVLATFWIAKRHWGLKAAFWSALTLLSSMHAVIQFRLATPDPYLILCHMLSLYFFFEGWCCSKWNWFAGMYIFLGLGLLAKGPVGLLLPGLTIFIFMLLTKTFTWKNIVALKLGWGIILILLFSLPWYWAVHVQTAGEWTRGFFLEHNLDRFDNGLKGHRGSFVLSFLFILAGMLPFSVYVVRAFKMAWKFRQRERLGLMAMVSVVVVAFFYAFSQTKLINYTAPAYPFLALLIGYCISKLSDGLETERVHQIELYVIPVFAFGLPVGTYYFMRNTEPFAGIAWIAWLLILLPVGVVVALVLSRRSFQIGLLAISLASMGTTFIIYAGPFQVIDNQSPVRKYQDLVQSHQHVVAYKDFDDAFTFYAQKTIPVFQDEKDLKAYLCSHDDVLVLSRDRNLNYMDHIPYLKCLGKGRDLFSRRSSGVYHER